MRRGEFALESAYPMYYVGQAATLALVAEAVSQSSPLRIIMPRSRIHLKSLGSSFSHLCSDPPQFLPSGRAEVAKIPLWKTYLFWKNLTFSQHDVREICYFVHALEIVFSTVSVGIFYIMDHRKIVPSSV